MKSTLLNSNAGSSCLPSSALSFYDTFRTVSGVPVFLLTTEPEPRLPGDDGEQQGPDSFFTSPALITRCAFSRDGSRLASGHHSGRVCVWDADHGTLLAERGLHDVAICDICFRGTSNDIVLTADREGNCVEWVLSRAENCVLRMECAPLWASGLADPLSASIDGQSSRFFRHGSLVVFAAIVETARVGSGSYMIDTPNPTLRFSVVDTDSIPQVSCMAQLSVEVEMADVVTSMEVSPDGEGLLVGFTNSPVEEGYTILWPDFRRDQRASVNLPYGTLGSWAPDSTRVVTWTVPEEPFPQDNEGCCAFLWDVQSLRDQMAHANLNMVDMREMKFEGLQPIVLRNPFGKNVLWCRFVLDEEGKSRLVMCVIRTTARLLFWDVETEVLTHVIPTGISTNDVILGSRECWKMCWVDGKFIKGLEPLEVTEDTKWMGAVSGHQNTAVIWDAAQGVELLRIALPQDLSEAVGVGVDLIMSPSPGNFAMIGYASILLFCPSVSRQAHIARFQEHSMVELEYSDACDTPDKKMRIAFSANGEVLAVLHVGSSYLHLWSLNTPIYIAVTDQSDGVYGDLMEFALAADFSLTGNGSAFLVTSTTSREMLIWECHIDAASVVGVIPSEDVGFCQAIGLMQGNKAIVTCESSGHLVWYQLHDLHRPTETPSSVQDNELRPLLDGSQEDLTETRTWKGRSLAGFSSVRAPRRFHSEISSSARSSAHRFSLAGSERQKAQGSHACRFSANCTLAVLMPDPERAFLWDLEARTILSVIGPGTDDGSLPASSIHSSRSLTHSSSLLKRITSDPDMLSQVEGAFKNLAVKAHSLISEKNVAVSENENVFILADTSSLVQQETDGRKIADHLFHEQKHGECDSLFVIHASHPEATRKLSGRRLQPWKGMAISADGRFVACVSRGTVCSQLLVWSCYAIDDLLPSFHSLKLKDCIQSKQRVMEHLHRLLQKFGGNLVNYCHPHGASLLFDAVDDVNDEVLDVALHYASKQHLKAFPNQVSLENGRRNAVELALKRRSPEIASKIMKYLMERVTYESQMARVLKACLVPMNINYPKIFVKTLHHPKLFSTVTDLRVLFSWTLNQRREMCCLQVPEVIFGKNRFVESTSDLLYVTEEDASLIWDRRCKQEGMEDDDPITTLALSKVLPYPDACRMGKDGLLRPMLVNDVSDVCFASFTVKAIVTHKWRKYGQRLLRREFLYYCLLLICFTTYSFLLCYQRTYNAVTREGKEENNRATAITISICWILTVPKLYYELVQASFYWRDYGGKGLFYWLKSAWNWMEMLCYATIVVVIPIGEYWLLQEGKRTIILSTFVALESILLWCKLLYFLQPFRKTGPLVIIVSAIARDILPFLLLAACVMFGFAVAFFVLYRHIRTPEKPSDHTFYSEDETTEILFSFENFGRTLFSMVRYLFGDFDSPLLFDAPSQVTAFFLFVLYMILITIILLNMMIAIMSDSFNRIKSTEETQFIKARAIAIDDIESMLSAKQKQTLEKGIGRYLHVAIPKYRHDKVMNGFKRRGGRRDSPKDVRKMMNLLDALVQREGRRDRSPSEENAASNHPVGAHSQASDASSSSIDEEEFGELQSLSSVGFDD